MNRPSSAIDWTRSNRVWRRSGAAPTNTPCTALQGSPLVAQPGAGRRAREPGRSCPRHSLPGGYGGSAAGLSTCPPTHPTHLTARWSAPTDAHARSTAQTSQRTPHPQSQMPPRPAAQRPAGIARAPHQSAGACPASTAQAMRTCTLSPSTSSAMVMVAVVLNTLHTKPFTADRAMLSGCSVPPPPAGCCAAGSWTVALPSRRPACGHKGDGHACGAVAACGALRAGPGLRANACTLGWAGPAMH